MPHALEEGSTPSPGALKSRKQPQSEPGATGDRGEPGEPVAGDVVCPRTVQRRIFRGMYARDPTKR
jgi:hypothetical protein